MAAAAGVGSLRPQAFTGASRFHRNYRSRHWRASPRSRRGHSLHCRSCGCGRVVGLATARRNWRAPESSSPIFDVAVAQPGIGHGQRQRDGKNATPSHTVNFASTCVVCAPKILSVTRSAKGGAKALAARQPASARSRTSSRQTATWRVINTGMSNHIKKRKGEFGISPGSL